jgi:predicted HAD superfamily hydrolase
MRNEHEVLLCKLVQNYIPGKALNLATSDAEKIREIMSDITEKYKADFPPQVGTPAHKAMHAVENGDNLEVTVAQRIENVEGYKAELARYNELASQHEMAAIQEHIDQRIVLVVDPLEATKTRIADTLKRYPLMREKKRKLYMYDTTLDGPLNWTTIKKRRLSVWAGAGPGLCGERLQAWKGGRAGT